MNNQDYEQKKRECWEEYFKHVVCGTDSHEYWFNKIFDRAYALGKEKETITQEEIEKEAEHYDDKHTEQLIYDIQNDRTSWKPLQDGICNAFKAGANFALGKQEKDADTVIQGWVARDEDGHLFMYCTKPERYEALQVWMGGYADFDLRNALFPDLTWDSEPEEVEIILKRKKK